ncbi:MAG: TetR/AcrR family transcriptional regulator [Hahellaceae bacterium]|nr:TetR/AcrR family transcriptional regulator [Hahellaceae bacterium]MCP5212740.1 TetR/AcrR family transcriptional regulator [Hahellaceae bacterium]
MGRPSNTEQRKQEIVEALLRVMSECGYEKASIQIIAKEAGLAPGLIHYHFKTKQEILLALVNWIAFSATERLEKMSEEVSDPWEKLGAFINARLAKGETELPQVVSAWVVIAGESIRQPEIKEVYQGLIEKQLEMLKTLIAEVWQGKSIESKEVVHLSAIIIAAMEGAFQLSATANEIMPKNYAAQSVLALIKNHIGA